MMLNIGDQVIIFSGKYTSRIGSVSKANSHRHCICVEGFSPGWVKCTHRQWADGPSTTMDREGPGMYVLHEMMNEGIAFPITACQVEFSHCLNIRMSEEFDW